MKTRTTFTSSSHKNLSRINGYDFKGHYICFSPIVNFNYGTNSLQLYPQNSVFISVNSLPGIFCSGAETLGVTATTLGTKSISFIMLRDGILFHLLLSHTPTPGLIKLSSTFPVNASAPGQAYQLEDLLHLNGLDSSDSCT